MNRSQSYLELHENSYRDKIMRDLDKLSGGNPSKEDIQAIANKNKMEFHTVRKMWAKHGKNESVNEASEIHKKAEEIVTMNRKDKGPKVIAILSALIQEYATSNNIDNLKSFYKDLKPHIK